MRTGKYSDFVLHLRVIDTKFRIREDAEKPEQKLKLDSFTTQTNTLDVDKHM